MYTGKKLATFALLKKGYKTKLFKSRDEYEKREKEYWILPKNSKVCDSMISLLQPREIPRLGATTCFYKIPKELVRLILLTLI